MLIPLALALLSCTGKDGGQPADSGQPADDAIAVDHLFALLNCAEDVFGFCPDGDPASFDRALYRDLYADPFGQGPAHGVYPDRDDNLYAGFALPQCEDSTVADPVTLDSDTDPATWACPDGSPFIRCSDGTRPVAWLNPASDPSSDKWLILISVGGAACYGDDCVNTAATNLHRFSSLLAKDDTLAGDATSSAGLFGLSDFGDYHRLIIDQCASGAGIGDSQDTARYTDETTGLTYDVPVFFHGSRIIRAALDRILNEAPVSPAQIVFASHSNGSRHAYLELDEWADWINDHPLSSGHVDVRLQANSLVHDGIDAATCRADSSCTDFLDAFHHGSDDFLGLSSTVSAPGSTDLSTICDDDGVGRCLTDDDGVVYAEVPADGVAIDSLAFQPGGETRALQDALGTHKDTSCVAAHPDDDDACLDAMHVLLYHIETPIYFGLSGYDQSMRSGNVSQASPAYEAWSLDDYHDLLLQYTLALIDRGGGEKDAVRAPGNGVWVDNSGNHQGPTNATKMKRTLLRDDGVELAMYESIRAWLDATDDHSPYCISDGEARSNPDNPMNTSAGGTPVSAADCF